MASSMYSKGLDAFLNGAINWTSDTIKVALVGSGYTANMSTDQFYSSVSSAVIGTPIALSNKSTSAGAAIADPAVSAALATGSTVTQIVVYKDTGTASTSPLIARWDITSTPTNGGTFTASWPDSSLHIFQL